MFSACGSSSVCQATCLFNAWSSHKYLLACGVVLVILFSEHINRCFFGVKDARRKGIYQLYLCFCTATSLSRYSSTVAYQKRVGHFNSWPIFSHIFINIRYVWQYILCVYKCMHIYFTSAVDFIINLDGRFTHSPILSFCFRYNLSLRLK